MNRFFRSAWVWLALTPLFAAPTATLSADDGAFLFSELFVVAESAPSDVENPPLLRANLSELKIDDPYRLRAVGTMYGEWACREGSGTGSAGGFSTGVFGGSLGVDRKLGKSVLAGLHAASATLNLEPDDARFDGSVSSVAGLAQMSLFGDLWYWDLSFGLGENKNRDDFAGESLRFTQTQWNYWSELGMKFRSGYTKIEPFLGFRYIYLSDESGSRFVDTGYFSADSGNSYRTMLGSRFSWDYTTYIARVKPSLWGMWVHEYGNGDIFTTSDQLDFPVAWRYADHNLPRDRMILGGGVAAQLRNMIDLWLHYDANFSGGYNAHTLSTGVNLKY